ncbi:hypothetical protein Tco_1391875 [Tanacetum coccineum]
MMGESNLHLGVAAPPALDELISNLKVHEVVMEKDSKIYRGKNERVKSIAFTGTFESSLEERVCLRTCLEPDVWIQASGCSKHIIGNKSLFSTYKAYDGERPRRKQEPIRRYPGRPNETYSSYMENKIFSEDIKRGPYSKDSTCLGLRKEYRLSLKNDMPLQDKMDDRTLLWREYIRLERRKKLENVRKCLNGKLLSMVDLNMALSLGDQRHKYLRFEGLQYTEGDIAGFEMRLAKIYRREVHWVQGQSVFTSRASRRLFDIRGPLVNELILEFFSTFRFGEVVLDLDTVGALQFQLGGVRRGSRGLGIDRTLLGSEGDASETIQAERNCPIRGGWYMVMRNGSSRGQREVLSKQACDLPRNEMCFRRQHDFALDLAEKDIDNVSEVSKSGKSRSVVSGNFQTLFQTHPCYN